MGVDTTLFEDIPGTLQEEDFDAMLKNKRAMLEKLQLEDDDPLKKIINDQEMIVKKISDGGALQGGGGK